MSRTLVLLFYAGCEAGGTPCTGDLEGTCSRSGAHCVWSWAEAADAATWCPSRDVSNARTAAQTCLGNHVLVATVGTTTPPSTLWYFYDADGGLVGITRRDDQFVMQCVTGKQGFQSPELCAASTSDHCCRLDFGKELACKGAADGG